MLTNRCIDIQEYLLLKGVEAVAIHGSKSMSRYASSELTFPNFSMQPRRNVSTLSSHLSPAQRTSWSPPA